MSVFPAFSPWYCCVVFSTCCCYNKLTGTPFPEGDLAPFPPGLDNETALANARAWCQARSSGKVCVYTHQPYACVGDWSGSVVLVLWHWQRRVVPGARSSGEEQDTFLCVVL